MLDVVDAERASVLANLVKFLLTQSLLRFDDAFVKLFLLLLEKRIFRMILSQKTADLFLLCLKLLFFFLSFLSSLLDSL